LLKPKIAFFVPGLGIYDRGAEVFVSELSKRLSENYEITFISRGKISGKGISIRGISRDNKIVNLIYRIPVIRELQKVILLDPLNIELLSTSISGFPVLLKSDFRLLLPAAGFWGNLACKIIQIVKNIPYICVGHSRFGYWEFLNALLFPDMYVSFTKANLDKLKKWFKKLESTVIPWGVDLERFNPKAVPVRLSLERPVFLCAAALDPVKRIHLAVRAVSRLAAGSLIVLGNGPLKEDLMKMGRALLGNRFLITSVSHEQMPAYYAASDVFTLPSAHEAFGGVYLEAMASNKPVVTTDDEIRKEIIGDAGIVCDCRNIQEYGKALNKASHTNFALRPRNQAEKFDWNTIAHDYDKLFKSIMQKNNDFFV